MARRLRRPPPGCVRARAKAPTGARTRPFRASLLALLGALLVVGCAMPRPEPTVATAEPTPLEALEPVLAPAEMANAIRFRTSVGLPADQAWIERVAADPASDKIRYGTPLTPVEGADLDARGLNVDAVENIIHTYGSQQPDWSGMFIDQHDGGLVVALFADRIPEHQAAIARLANPQARWEVRQARWSRTQLEAFHALVTAEEPWLATVDASFDSSAIDETNNRILLRISSTNPAAPALIIEHFDGAAWLRVESDGIGRWKGPRGNLEVEVVTPDGAPMLHADCVPEPDVQSANVPGDMGTGTSDAGICSFVNVAASWFDVRIFVSGPGPRREVGLGRAHVPAGGTVRIRVVVDPS
jgi:hypothetical protein